MKCNFLLQRLTLLILLMLYHLKVSWMSMFILCNHYMYH